jgi:hypothetical protein
MIADASPPGSKGVDYLIPGNTSNLAMGLVDSFMEYTKSLSSAQDASTGDVGKGQLNASAIMLLQKAAGVPIESIKKRFYRAIEDIGRVWEEFWKVKYNTTRKVTLKDDDGKPYPEEFRGTDHAEVGMNLKIDIGPSSQYSEELMMSSLDKLFDGQYITLEDYLEYAPQNVIPFRDRLLKKIEKQKQAQNIQVVMQMPPELQQLYMNSPPEVQDQMVREFTQQQQAAMQTQDPQEQFKQQTALKEMDNQHDMRKAELQSQTDLQKEAMRQQRSVAK